jgi:hypothetical protein
MPMQGNLQMTGKRLIITIIILAKMEEILLVAMRLQG